MTNEELEWPRPHFDRYDTLEEVQATLLEAILRGLQMIHQELVAARKQAEEVE